MVPSRALFAVFLGALWLAPSWARAQSPADTERAEKIFSEGKVLMENKDYPRACAKFEESYALVKGVAAQYFLARCVTELGKTATAYHHYEEVAEISSRVGQQDRAEVARQRMAELEPRLMKIRIEVIAPAPGLEVTCDGKSIPEASWNHPLAFDPGRHVVTARLPDREPWSRDVELSNEGSVRTVIVPNLAEESETPAPEPETPAPAPSLLISGIAVGGLGLAGLAIGGALAAVAQSTYDDSDAFCDDTGCDQPGLDLVDDARSLGDGATAMFVLGGALLAGGVTMLIIGSLDGEQEDALVPVARVGLGTGSLTWRF